MSTNPTSFVPKLSQSKSKGDFFKQLGWKENDDTYTRLYQMMMVSCPYLKAIAGSDVDDLDRRRPLLAGQGQSRTGKT
jgi:hypothetical protein